MPAIVCGQIGGSGGHSVWITGHRVWMPAIVCGQIGGSGGHSVWITGHRVWMPNIVTIVICACAAAGAAAAAWGCGQTIGSVQIVAITSPQTVGIGGHCVWIAGQCVWMPSIVTAGPGPCASAAAGAAAWA